MRPSSSRGQAFQTKAHRVASALQSLRTPPSHGLPARNEVRQAPQAPNHRGDRRTAHNRLEAGAVQQPLRFWEQRRRENWIRVDGVGEVPSIEVGTGHVITTTRTLQFAMVALQFYATLRTVLAEIFFPWFGFGKFCLVCRNFNFHRIIVGKSNAQTRRGSAHRLKHASSTFSQSPFWGQPRRSDQRSPHS